MRKLDLGLISELTWVWGGEKGSNWETNTIRMIYNMLIFWKCWFAGYHQTKKCGDEQNAQIGKHFNTAQMIYNMLIFKTCWFGVEMRYNILIFFENIDLRVIFDLSRWWGGKIGWNLETYSISLVNFSIQFKWCITCLYFFKCWFLRYFWPK